MCGWCVSVCLLVLGFVFGCVGLVMFVLFVFCFLFLCFVCCVLCVVCVVCCVLCVVCCAVSDTHLGVHEAYRELVGGLLLEKKEGCLCRNLRW